MTPRFQKTVNKMKNENNNSKQKDTPYLDDRQYTLIPNVTKDNKSNCEICLKYNDITIDANKYKDKTHFHCPSKDCLKIITSGNTVGCGNTGKEYIPIISHMKIHQTFIDKLIQIRQNLLFGKNKTFDKCINKEENVFEDQEKEKIDMGDSTDLVVQDTEIWEDPDQNRFL